MRSITKKRDYQKFEKLRPICRNKKLHMIGAIRSALHETFGKNGCFHKNLNTFQCEDCGKFFSKIMMCILKDLRKLSIFDLIALDRETPVL